MAVEPPAVLKVTHWGEEQLIKERNGLSWGIISVTSCIAFTMAQCEETPCEAAGRLRESPPLAGG